MPAQDASSGRPEQNVDRLTIGRLGKQPSYDHLGHLRGWSPIHFESRRDVSRVDEDLADAHSSERHPIGAAEMPRMVPLIGGIDDGTQNPSPSIHDFENLARGRVRANDQIDRQVPLRGSRSELR